MINWISSRIKKRLNRQIGWLLISLFAVQLVAGLVNVLLLAPVWMQMLHLLLSDLVWISLVLFAAESLGQGELVRNLEAEAN